MVFFLVFLKAYIYKKNVGARGAGPPAAPPGRARRGRGVNGARRVSVTTPWIDALRPLTASWIGDTRVLQCVEEAEERRTGERDVLERARAARVTIRCEPNTRDYACGCMSALARTTPSISPLSSARPRSRPMAV